MLSRLSVAFSAIVFCLIVFDPPMPVVLGPTAKRTVYFKLPIAGARFHWMFDDRDAFLAGALTLRIINEERDDTLVVFRDGILRDGWTMVGDARSDGAFYFGLETSHRYATAPDDSLIITLTVREDLLGRGPYHEGVLRAGTWTRTGTYSALYGGRWNPMDYAVLRDRPPVAYLQCWDDVWPIEITAASGWQGVEPAEGRAEGWARWMRPRRGADGRRCGSHV